MMERPASTIKNIIKNYNGTGEMHTSRRGGNHRSKITAEEKEQVKKWTDEEFSLTLWQLVEKVKSEYNKTVSIQTIERCLNSFQYISKVANSIPAARNIQSTITQRFTYAQVYRRLETTHPAEDFVFMEEIGFSVSSRPKRGRSEAGKRATTVDPYTRS